MRPKPQRSDCFLPFYKVEDELPLDASHDSSNFSIKLLKVAKWHNSNSQQQLSNKVPPITTSEQKQNLAGVTFAIP
jgi:hypothetical protein